MKKTEYESLEVTADNFVELVDFSKITDDKSGHGLVVVMVQDIDNNDNLMLAYANKEALQKTMDTGMATFWTRSRQALWTKGETSGNFMKVKRISMDCDGDAVLYHVEPQGEAKGCHTGERSCFYRGFDLDQDTGSVEG